MKSTMSPLTLLLAREHQHELSKEAELLAMERSVRRSTQEPTAVTLELRQRLGHAMIQFGNFIGGTGINTGEMTNAREAVSDA